MRKKCVVGLCAFFYMSVTRIYAQATAPGKDAFTQATSQVKQYFSVGTDLMYAVGGILGLVGAVKVFTKWNNGEQDTGKTAAAWFGSCIFLVVVATILNGFFKLN